MVGDIIDIAQLDLPDLGTYVLQSHFDFVVIDERQTPLLAIEFDGPGHDPVNTAKKDPICQQADLTLVRINGFEQDQVMNRDRTSVHNSCSAVEDLRDDPELDSSVESMAQLSRVVARSFQIAQVKQRNWAPSWSS